MTKKTFLFVCLLGTLAPDTHAYNYTIPKELYGYEDYNCDYYGNAYINGINGYPGSGSYIDYLEGPVLYGSDGNINGSIADYINSCFGSAASSFATGDNISNLFKGSENSGVIGIYETGSNVSHAVILTGYDAETNTYTYYDPSKSSQGSNQTISASQLKGAIDCLSQ